MAFALRRMGVVACLMIFLSIVGCSSPYQDKVVGTWETDMPLNPTIKMSADGTGSMTFSVLGQSASKEMKWRLRGSNLIFTIDGKDGGGLIKNMEADKFILNDPAVSKDFVFKRVKK